MRPPPELSKWADEAQPEDRLADAARRVLKARLKAVRVFLKRAGKPRKPDPEDVHQLRVWTRRSIAAVKCFQSQLERRDAKWLLKKLRAIRKAAGDARDDDVLLARWEAAGIDPQARRVRRVRRHRRRAQRPIRDMWRKLLRSGRWRRRVKRVLRRLRRGGRARFADWGDRRIRRSLKKFFKAARRADEDAAHLHKFRIRGKQLRYTMELTASLYPPIFRESLYEEVEQLQDRLGKLNDHRVARDRFLRWCREENGQADSSWTVLIDRESSDLAVAEAEFRNWWTAERRESIHRAFAECLKSGNGK